MHNNEKLPYPPWKEILTSVPVWAMNLTSIGSAFGFYMVQTELPTYLGTIQHFPLTSVNVSGYYWLGWITTSAWGPSFEDSVESFPLVKYFSGELLEILWFGETTKLEHFITKIPTRRSTFFNIVLLKSHRQIAKSQVVVQPIFFGCRQKSIPKGDGRAI